MTQLSQIQVADLLNRNHPLWLVDLDLSGVSLRNADLKNSDLSGSKRISTLFNF